MKKIAATLIFVSLPLSSMSYSQSEIDPPSLARSIVAACETASDNRATAICLNSQIESLMRGRLNQYYRSKLSQLLEREGIQNFEARNLKNLFEMYPVQIPVSDRFGNASECVDFSWGIRGFKNTKVSETANALLQSALFAARFATYGLGEPFSPVLKFKRIDVCEGKSRLLKLNREDRALETKFQFSNTVTAESLWKEWQNGNALNPRPGKKRGIVNQVFEKTNYIGLSPDEFLDEAIYQKWTELNPTGEIRRNIRFIAWKVIDQLTAKLMQDPNAFIDHELRNLPERYSKGASAMTQPLKSQIASRIMERLRDPAFIQKAIAKHVAMSSASCSSVTEMEVSRDLKGWISVANAKNIGVNVDFNFPFGAYDEAAKDLYMIPDKACNETRLKNSDKVDAKIHINLNDNVGVTVVGLARLTDAIFLLPRVILLDLLDRPQGPIEKIAP